MVQETINISMNVIGLSLSLLPPLSLTFSLSFLSPPWKESCKVFDAWILICWFWQIFRSLSYIHRSIGVCHRDIKPQNLLVCFLFFVWFALSITCMLSISNFVCLEFIATCKGRNLTGFASNRFNSSALRL